jgi:hypothetical protein
MLTPKSTRLLCAITLLFLSGTASRAETCRLEIPVSVFSDRGESAENLAPANFTVEFAGSQHKVLSVRRIEITRVVLLLDHSGSMGSFPGKWEQAIAMARDFVVMAPATMSIGLMIIDDALDLTIRPSLNHANLDQALSNYRRADKAPRGRTRVFDGLSGAIRMLLEPQAGDSVFVITDGGDNSSRTVLSRVRDEAIKSQVRIFVSLSDVVPFGVGVTPEEEVGKNNFRELAVASGGLSILADNESATRMAGNALLALRGIASGYSVVAEVPARNSLTKIKLRVATGQTASRKGYVLYPPRVAPKCSQNTGK